MVISSFRSLFEIYKKSNECECEYDEEMKKMIENFRMKLLVEGFNLLLIIDKLINCCFLHIQK